MPKNSKKAKNRARNMRAARKVKRVQGSAMAPWTSSSPAGAYSRPVNLSGRS